jgi:hypothetical protein
MFAKASSRRQFLCTVALPRRKDARARIRRGQEDSLVNFVLYGTSFTGRPRGEQIDLRIQDFLRALQHPGNNERLLWLKTFAKPTERYVRDNVARYFAGLDGSYKDRGLSIDTNFRPNFAIEQTLATLRIPSIRRAAIIGPGLDFTDKDQGFDYYPLQTLQPFALIDSLLRLGHSNLHIGVFDINPQPLDHLTRARAKRSYIIQLALDETRQWNPDVLSYWRRFGDRIGKPVAALPVPPQVHNVQTRAVEIRPEIVRLLAPERLDIVTERPRGEPYDLIVATNVLVYYDAADQARASSNIASMMSPRGIFLSNTQIPECALHAIGNIDVRYSAEPGDDDRILIYSNARLRRGIAPE